MIINNKQKNIFFLSIIIIAMTSLVYFSVPLYKIFCQATGFKGFNADQVDNSYPYNEDSSLKFNIIFDTEVGQGLDWLFEAPKKMSINEGVKYSVVFKAKNNSDNDVTGTSSFNVLPPKIGPYLSKIECFCFLDQALSPGEVVEFPVTFYIDPLIKDDPEASAVRNVTLSYTFFPKID